MEGAAEDLRAVGVHVPVVAEAAAEAVEEIKNSKMKTALIHTIPVVISLIGIRLMNHKFNPISLKGPDFLKFYILLLFGFYLTVFAGRYKNLTVTFYFSISIFLLGICKLCRGVFLSKPVGFLVILLILQFIVILFFKQDDFNQKIN